MSVRNVGDGEHMQRSTWAAEQGDSQFSVAQRHMTPASQRHSLYCPHLLGNNNSLLPSWLNGTTYFEEDIQCLWKAFIPLDLLHILVCYSLNSKLIKYMLFLTNLHTLPHTDKVKMFLEMLANLLKIKYRNLIYISIHTPESIHVRITLAVITAVSLSG